MVWASYAALETTGRSHGKNKIDMPHILLSWPDMVRCATGW